MNHITFFNKSSRKLTFQQKLKIAVKSIREKKSFIAEKVYEAIKTKQVSLHSFKQLSAEHFLEVRKAIAESSEIELPEQYPPAEETLNIIENKLGGFIVHDCIYLCSRGSSRRIALTIVHEVTHYLNTDIWEEELTTKQCEIACYRDEVRSFLAEEAFAKGFCLTRNDVKKVHEKVTRLYPEYVAAGENTKAIGYVFSSFDTPRL
ncbi:hypothetical protein [Legionella septentrionalis]|uniref:hypothetical protein n=1 Tax=Legionella septentrionalis TaxID=2498109 RepID=UPI000F8ED663|nr:hypothetical protein [Legionella septentrionalis]RUR02962.1 hypothetical protein ELY11_00990 [Legionella septentrionalis]